MVAAAIPNATLCSGIDPLEKNVLSAKVYWSSVPRTPSNAPTKNAASKKKASRDLPPVTGSTQYVINLKYSSPAT